MRERDQYSLQYTAETGLSFFFGALRWPLPIRLIDGD